MDVLDQVLAPSRDLLARVDAALIGSGAPADHPIWPLLRRVGSLPGDALEFVAGFQPDRLAAAEAELRVHAEEYDGLVVPSPVEEWTGPAAETFAAHSDRLRQHLNAAGADSLAGRLLATAEHLHRLAVWGTALRRELAYRLARAFTSAEAVALHQPAPTPWGGQRAGTEAAHAAAAVGVLVLGPIADALPDVEALLRDASLGDLPYRAPVLGTAGTVTETRIQL